ncbi:hypothetical protein SAMN04488056_101473 [Cohaesibacter marisflavi]|uniref:Uncharacterized protein n=1 Tax=Cohaesibacter marisflavi TaxID=655353 RepID=A0A1I5AFM6_9HYPH|nr:hypothetical protein SAMN04488056_101473 [Cohaesibacter marisflavi]
MVSSKSEKGVAHAPARKETMLREQWGRRSARIRSQWQNTLMERMKPVPCKGKLRLEFHLIKGMLQVSRPVVRNPMGIRAKAVRSNRPVNPIRDVNPLGAESVEAVGMMP